jgi:predicted phosphodiesterase
MRFAVLADVHANLHALTAALAALRGENIDRYIVAGDLVGYGPLPDECVEVVAGLDAVCVAGNHDLIALGELSDDRCIALARRSLQWTREVMRAETRDFLAALPRRADAGAGVVVAHGSLDDPQEYTTEPGQAVAQLARLGSQAPGARVLVLGHTHRPWACSARGELMEASGTLALADASLVLNPGAVGQSRERLARARFAVLDTEQSTAAFHAVAYDVDGCRRALRERGLDPGSYRLRRSALRWARRVARRARRRWAVGVAARQRAGPLLHQVRSGSRVAG